MRVIPSRADGEGPHRRSKITRVRRSVFEGVYLVDRESVFCVVSTATVRSLAVCAARDDRVLSHAQCHHALGYFFASKRGRYFANPSSFNFSAGTKRSAAEFMQ